MQSQSQDPFSQIVQGFEKLNIEVDPKNEDQEESKQQLEDRSLNIKEYNKFYNYLQQVNKQIFDKQQFVQAISIKIKQEQNDQVDQNEKKIIQKLNQQLKENQKFEKWNMKHRNAQIINHEYCKQQLEKVEKLLNEDMNEQYIFQELTSNKIENYSLIISTFDILINQSFLEDFKNKVNYEYQHTKNISSQLTKSIKILHSKYAYKEFKPIEQKKKQDIGTSVHSLIESFLKLIIYKYVNFDDIKECTSYLEQEIGNDNMKIILSKAYITYLYLKDVLEFNNFEIESSYKKYQKYDDKESKRFDLLAFNEDNALIIDWKFSDKLQTDLDHFKSQLDCLQQQKIFRQIKLLVIPFLNENFISQFKL
ncbi:hypothetical protein ABPG74_002610 [Tetrahymena malaccensis]